MLLRSNEEIERTTIDAFMNCCVHSYVDESSRKHADRVVKKTRPTANYVTAVMN